MDVQDSWDCIVGWCRAHAHATHAAIHSPAREEEIKAAEATTGGSWPDDLRTWFGLADGTEHTPAGYLLPGYCPLPLLAVTDDWLMWQEITTSIVDSWRREQADPHRRAIAESLAGRSRAAGYQDPEDPYDITRLEADPAGTPAGLFLPSFLPIADDQSGSYLFVDRRAGPLSGSVREHFKGAGDRDGSIWASVADMLEDVCHALRASTAVRLYEKRVFVEDGRLHWDFAD